VQTLFWQVAPAPQAGAVGQQSSAGPPQATQTDEAVAQIVLAAVQSPPAQQAIAGPPQAPQAPF
jgi:hypothetical protein